MSITRDGAEETDLTHLQRGGMRHRVSRVLSAPVSVVGAPSLADRPALNPRASCIFEPLPVVGNSFGSVRFCVLGIDPPATRSDKREKINSLR